MNAAYIPLLVSVVAGLFTIGGAYLTVRYGKKKTSQDAARTLTDIALSLVAPLKQEIEDLNAHVNELEADIGLLKDENLQLHRWSQLLFSQVLEEGGEPIPFARVKNL